MVSSVLAFAMASPPFAVGKQAEVLHWWTSSGEAAAIKVFADGFTAAGGEWIDGGIGGGAAKAAFMNRLMGGDPPQVSQLNTPREFEEVVDAELHNNLDADAGNWANVLPILVNSQVTRYGHSYSVPVNIHGSNWLWYNKHAFEKAGAEPPTDWDSFFAAAG